MAEDIEGFKHPPSTWVVEHREVFIGKCLFCEAPYVGTQVHVTTLTAVVEMCPQCWIEFSAEYPEVKAAEAS